MLSKAKAEISEGGKNINSPMDTALKNTKYLRAFFYYICRLNIPLKTPIMLKRPIRDKITNPVQSSRPLS